MDGSLYGDYRSLHHARPGFERNDLDTRQAPDMVPCFTPGTLIATPRGEIPAGELSVGDRVITRDNGIRQIRWIGCRPLTLEILGDHDHLQPVLIRAGSLGNGLPERDMQLSPDHRILINSDRAARHFDDREVLVPSRYLVGLPGITRLHLRATRYMHFLMDQHEVILSDGIWSESFQPAQQVMTTLGPALRNEIFALFPNLRQPGEPSDFAPARRSLTQGEAALLSQ